MKIEPRAVSSVQRITGRAFRISSHLDWQIGNGFFKSNLGTQVGAEKKNFCALLQIVCYTAVFSVVTQSSSPLCDDTKNGCVADYFADGLNPGLKSFVCGAG